MISDKYQRLFIALAALIILVAGILFGSYLGEKLKSEQMESIKIGLSFTTIIILLIVGSLVLETKQLLVSMQSKKR